MQKLDLNPVRENLTVEYDPRVLEAIRAHVEEGFDRITPAGVEAGGVLFGTYSRRRLSVAAMRPAPCAYTSGPVFVLDPNDHQRFQEILSLQASDPTLEGLKPVGWFLSHVSDSLVLRPSDREIFDRYFEQPWHVVLVIRPGRVGCLRAATVVRDLDDDRVLNEFTIRQARDSESRSAVVAEEPPPSPTQAAAVKVKLAPPAEAVVHVPRPQPARAPLFATVQAARHTPLKEPLRLAPPKPEPAPQRIKRFWPAWTLAASLAVVAGFGATLYLSAKAPDTFFLQAIERDGIMHIEWDPNARTVSKADRAELEIIDGNRATSRGLGREELKRGEVVTLRKDADLTARLRLYDAKGMLHQEIARYAGRPVAKDDQALQSDGQASVERLALEDQNDKLRNQLARERQRTEELQRHMKALQRAIQDKTTR